MTGKGVVHACTPLLWLVPIFFLMKKTKKSRDPLIFIDEKSSEER